MLSKEREESIEQGEIEIAKKILVLDVNNIKIAPHRLPTECLLYLTINVPIILIIINSNIK